MSTPQPQQVIVAACELELERHGDSFRGAGYTRSQAEAAAQYDVMLGVVRETEAGVTLLDLGCGLAHMLDHIDSQMRYRHIAYSGADLSQRYLDAARTRRPDARLQHIDVLASDRELPEYNYVVMNGLFNYRGQVSQAEMLRYWERVIEVAFRHCRQGIAFNVMSKIVDWERDDLFHLPFDTLAASVSRLSRHFQIRHDYGTFEYTTYVYREPRRG